MRLAAFNGTYNTSNPLPWDRQSALDSSYLLQSPCTESQLPGTWHDYNPEYIAISAALNLFNLFILFYELVSAPLPLLTTGTRHLWIENLLLQQVLLLLCSLPYEYALCVYDFLSFQFRCAKIHDSCFRLDTKDATSLLWIK